MMFFAILRATCACRSKPGWDQTVAMTVPLISKMNSKILGERQFSASAGHKHLMRVADAAVVRCVVTHKGIASQTEHFIPCVIEAVIISTSQAYTLCANR